MGMVSSSKSWTMNAWVPRSHDTVQGQPLAILDAGLSIKLYMSVLIFLLEYGTLSVISLLDQRMRGC